MPTSLRDDYTNATLWNNSFVKSTDYRSRNWTNTIGFQGVGRTDLPENSYTDRQIRSSQSPTLRYYVYLWPYSGNGIDNTDQVVAEGNQWYMNFYYPGNLMWQFLTPQLRDLDTLTNEAKTKALLKAGDMKTNFAVSIAEADKTGDLILETARRIDKAYRALRKGDFREVAKQLNISPSRVHKTWLEYRYGWLPLMMDVKGSAELLAQHHLKRAEDFTVSATAVSEGSDQFAQSTSGPGTWGYSRVSKGTHAARVKLRCRIDNDAVAAFQQMGLVNPALVAWELVPYSFVFDWFISVGDWLTACSALQGLDVITAMSSSLSSYEGSYSKWFRAYDAYSTRYYGGRPSFRSWDRNYSRQPLNVAQLTVYPVVNSDVFNMKRVITSLALMRSSSSRLVRI